MTTYFRFLLSLVYLIGLACVAYAFFSLISESMNLFYYLILLITRHLFQIFNHLFFLLSRDNHVAKSAIILNCQHIYRRRIKGKSKCNPIRYYGCKWRFEISRLPSFRHTLILDLDETLVYSCRYADASTIGNSLECIGITILRQNKYISFYVFKRPYLDLFLDYVCKWYDVVVFTAGEKPYADAVLNVIDPKGKISKRFYKDDCDFVNGRTVKRITTVSPNVSSTMIIDNNPECYRFDKCNAIPITSWYGDAKDKELKNLLPFLDLMQIIDDVRCVLALNY